MEILAYSHLATAEESSTVLPSTAGLNWKKFSSLGMMGLLSAATVLGALSVTANSASACNNPCGGGGYDHGYESRDDDHDYHRPKYRKASYSKKHSRRGGSYLHHGSRGYKVAKLQHKLGEMGYFDYPRATGYYGRITKHAVKEFQRDHGLRPDGIVGHRTMAALADY